MDDVGVARQATSVVIVTPKTVLPTPAPGELAGWGPCARPLPSETVSIKDELRKHEGE